MKADCLSYVIAIKRVSLNGSQRFTSMLCNTFARSTALDLSHMSECKVGYSLSFCLSLNLLPLSITVSGMLGQCTSGPTLSVNLMSFVSNYSNMKAQKFCDLGTH